MFLSFPVFSESEHEVDEVIEEIVVYGRALKQRGSSVSASEGVVGYSDFSTRPMQRVGEFVEVVPGMVATQHSGEGKANQYFLRGMNLDHGTDFSAYFLGMPVNMRSHAHGQGYLDLNFLIPEIISTVRFAKGPYHADRGDFSTAGTTSFDVYEAVDSPFIKVETGSDSYIRALGVGSLDTEKGHLLSALELMRNDGPWDLPGDLKKTNFVAQYAGHVSDAEIRAALTVYDNEWRSTDQIPERLVASGSIGRFGYVDPSLGGRSSRINLIAGVDNGELTSGLFISRYELNLFGNFTYFQESPSNGDAHEQVDRRWIFGGFLEHQQEITDKLAFRTGTDLRNDRIGEVSLHSVRQRERFELVRRDEIDWLSLGAFAEIEIKISQKLRGLVGLRGDYYDYQVNADTLQNGGEGSDHKWLPSIGFAYEINDISELYLNWGQGFHSNDVRGATISIDPVSKQSVDPIDIFVDQAGAEVGYRLERGSELVINIAYFWLESDSELLFVGDSGSTEPSDGSTRAGLELGVFWEFGQGWMVDVSGSLVDSKFLGPPAGFQYIPNAHGRVMSVGITKTQRERWTWSLRMRSFGDAALIEDDSLSHSGTTMVNMGLSRYLGDWTVGLDVYNIFDSEDYDIAYWYSSKMKLEAKPIEDIHFHPVTPRSLRASVEYRF